MFVYTDEAVVDEDIIEEKEHTDALSSAYKLSFSDDMNRLADSSTRITLNLGVEAIDFEEAIDFLGGVCNTSGMFANKKISLA